MNNLLITPIEFLKGVGPKKADLLKKELRIFTFNDLLTYFPFRYIDRSQFHKVSDLIGLNGPAQLKGKIVGMMDVGSGRGKRLTAQFQDESGMINLVWFKGAGWIKKSIKINEEIIVYGRPKQFGGKWNIPHPEMSSVKITGDKLKPVYSSTELLSINGMDTKGIEKLTGVLLDQIHGQIEELLPESVIQGNRLIGREQAILKVHRPKTEQDAQEARLRLKFEELFFLQMELLVRKKITIQKSKGVRMAEVGDVFNDFYKNHIPFELTGAQKKVLKEIRQDLNTGHHMNRLLQGDVGSGKTLVALLTMLLGIGNGFQAALMAPTEILAIQHNESISEMMEKLDIKVALLTGSTKKKDRIVLHEKLQSGEIDILIGTHALFQPDVIIQEFRNCSN